MALTKIKSSGIAANAITPSQLTGNTLANILIAGDNITIAANGRISSSGGGGSSTGGVIGGPVLLTNTTINSNIVISAGQNGFSIGPVTIADNANVTIAPGQRWLIL